MRIKGLLLQAFHYRAHEPRIATPYTLPGSVCPLWRLGWLARSRWRARGRMRGAAIRYCAWSTSVSETG